MHRRVMIAAGAAVTVVIAGAAAAIPSGAAETASVPSEVATEGLVLGAFPDSPVGRVTFAPMDRSVALLPSELDGLAGELADLVDFHDEDFTASWYDGASGQMHVRVVTDKGYELLETELGKRLDEVVVVKGARSARDLQESADKYLTASDLGMSDRARMWGLSPDGSHLNIAVDGGMTVAEASGIDDALDYPVVVSQNETNAVTATEDRWYDPSPYAGGARYGIRNSAGTWNGRCTTGYGFQTDGSEYVLSAGHCMDYGTTFDRMWGFTGPHGGPWTAQQYMGNFGNRSTWDGQQTRRTNDGQYHGDLSITNVTGQGREVGDMIWISTTSKREVQQRHAPTINQGVCRSGTSTGQLCGYRVWAINATVSGGGWLWRKIDLAEASVSSCASGGDSGGPVYTYLGNGKIDAVGVIAGNASYGNGTCDLLLTGAEEAVQAWGGDLDFAT